MQPRYNEEPWDHENYLVISGSHYIIWSKKKQRNIKSWDQQNDLVIRGFCYIRPLYNEVPLYNLHPIYNFKICSRVKTLMCIYQLDYLINNRTMHQCCEKEITTVLKSYVLARSEARKWIQYFKYTYLTIVNYAYNHDKNNGIGIE